MPDLPLLLLAGAASAIHLALLSTSPLVLDLVTATERMLEGRTPPPFGHGWRLLASRMRPGAAHLSPPLLTGFGSIAAASILVPSFATGMLTGPIADLVLVALLLVGGGLAVQFAAMDPVSTGRRLGASALSLPALLLAALALALIAGTTGLDAAIAAAPNAARVPLGLAILALALAGLADLDAGETDLTAPMSAVARLAASLRLLAWLDLVAAFLPPWSTTSATAGPLAWLAALLLWPVKLGVLAVGLGAARFFLGAARPSWRLACLRTASLSALLSTVLMLIGQTLE